MQRGVVQVAAALVHQGLEARAHEIDIVVAGRERDPVAVECKWKAGAFDPSSLLAFRRKYPAGPNFVVASDVSRAWTRRYGDVAVQFVTLHGLVEGLQPHSGSGKRT